MLEPEGAVTFEGYFDDEDSSFEYKGGDPVKLYTDEENFIECEITKVKNDGSFLVKKVEKDL